MPDVKTTHPTVQQLTDYGSGRLPPGQLSAIHQHVVACSICRARVEKRAPDSSIGPSRAAGRQRRAVAHDASLGLQHGAAGGECGPGQHLRRRTSRTGGVEQVRDPGETRSGRHGRGLQGQAHLPGRTGRHQGHERQRRRRPRGAPPLPARDAGGRQAEAPQHRAGAGRRAGGRFAGAGHGNGSRHHPGATGQAARRFAGGLRLQLHRAGGRGLAARAREGHGASRHQAGQPDCHAQGSGRSRCSTSVWRAARASRTPGPTRRPWRRSWARRNTLRRSRPSMREMPTFAPTCTAWAAPCITCWRPGRPSRRIRPSTSSSHRFSRRRRR